MNTPKGQKEKTDKSPKTDKKENAKRKNVLKRNYSKKALKKKQNNQRKNARNKKKPLKQIETTEKEAVKQIANTIKEQIQEIATNTKDTLKDMHSYAKILQIFPTCHPVALRLMFNLCEKKFNRTVDNILYVKRVCYFLQSAKKLRQGKIDLNSNNSILVKTNKSNKENTSTLVQGLITSQMQVQNDVNQNNIFMGYNYPSDSGIQNISTPLNDETNNIKNNAITCPIPVYSNYSLSSNSSYNYPNSIFSDFSSISDQTNRFYNSQDINTTNSSSFGDSSSERETYITNGSPDEIDAQLNNFIDEISFDNQCHDSFINNFVGNFRTSTPELPDSVDPWQY